MIKTLGIAISFSIGLGSVIGYSLQKMEANQPQKNEAVAATASPKPETQKVDRDSLSRRLSVCLNAKLDPKWIESLTDKTLDALTRDTCKAAS